MTQVVIRFFVAQPFSRCYEFDDMQVRNCGPGHSFFKLIDEHWGDRPAKFVFHRICTLMRIMGARSVIIEALEEVSERERVEAELDAIGLRLGGRPESRVNKFTFIRKAIDSTAELGGMREEDYLGYAIVLRVRAGTTPDCQRVIWTFCPVARSDPGESRIAGGPMFTAFRRIESV